MLSKEHKPSIIYFHSGRGLYEEKQGLLHLSSTNLVDFFVEVFNGLPKAVLVVAKSRRMGEVKLGLKKNTQVFNLTYPEVGEGKLKQIHSVLIFAKEITSEALRKEIRSADYSVSVALSFYGTILGLFRTIIARKKHSFIVRGNRLETVRQSSRSTLNKHFAVARVFFYGKIMLWLLKSGRAEIWFQGQEGYENLRKKLNNTIKGRVFLLNAVLRKLANGGIPPNQKKSYDIVFVGNVNKEKGIFELIEAVSILRSEGLKVTVAVIGEGPEKNLAVRAAQSLLVSEQIRFYGYVASPQRLVTLVGMARVFVLPSYTEGLPRAMLESMSLGIPVLVTPVGGIKYVIEDGRNGFLVEPRSAAKLAEKIKEVLQVIKDRQTDVLVDRARRDAAEYAFARRARYFRESSINRPNSLKEIEL